MADDTFDVFLSHNSLDKPIVRQIAEALRLRRLQVWLDESDLAPGRPWQDELDKVIRTVRSAAVLVGRNGLGRWQMLELRACQTQMVERGLPVTPVFLPGAARDPHLPVFLAELHSVDLRAGLTKEGLDRLVWGITGEMPASSPGQSAPSRPSAPRRHNLPFPSLGDLFKGRDFELRILSDAPATAITQPQTIHGLGGIGKTRLAVEHAWRSGDRYDKALFVVADSPQVLRSNLAWLSRPSLLDLPQFETASEERTVEAVLCWLQEHDRWLVILDNVDSLEAERAVRAILPSLATGRVLITSRLREWPPSVRRQLLATLTPEEAQTFLLERTASDRNHSPDDPKTAHRLAETLGYLPIALEQASAYIAHHQMSLSAYLEDWQLERERVLHWYKADVMQDPASLAVTWQKTFQQLTPMAATILRLSAYLAPEPIPEEMFEQEASIVEESVQAFCEETGLEAGDSSIRSALADLAAFSMATRAGASFAVHRMVQEVVRSSIPEAHRRDWIERSLRMVNDYSPIGPRDVRTWPAWDPLRPHAEIVVQHAHTVAISSPTTRLMNQLASLLWSQSFYNEAEPLMRRALEIDRQAFGENHINVGKDLNNLALLLQDTNRLAEAEPMMRRALQIFERDFGDNHPNVATNLTNLAQLLKATDRLAEAEPLLRRALQIDQKAFGENDPEVATDSINLASLLQNTNRLVEAEPLMRQALQIDQQAFGENHPEVAMDRFHLASLLQDTNRLTEAEPMMRHALEIFEQSLGAEHRWTRIAREKLSSIIEK